MEVIDRLSDVSSKFYDAYENITVKYTFDGKPKKLNFAQISDWIPEYIADYLIKGITTIPGV